MDDLRRVIRRAAFRILVGRFVRSLLLTGSAVIALLGLVLGAQRLFAFDLDWPLAWAGGAAGAVVAALFWTWLTRPDRLAVARAVDERAGLREAISTALCVSHEPDPWSRATVEHAVQASRRVQVRQAFPMSAPRLWPAPVVALAIFGALWLALPQGDVLGWLAGAEAAAKEREEFAQAVELVKTADEELKKELAKINDPGLEEGLTDAADAPKPQTAEEVRQSAIKKLTSLQDRLSEIRQGEKGMRLDAMREQMSKLRRPGPGPLTEVAAALQQGDFRKANEELAKLADKLALDQLTSADKDRLGEQLKSLAEQLEKLAKEQDSLAKKLDELGLSKDLALDPEALAKALEQMEGLSDQQKKQLLDAAKAAAEACEKCNGMAGALSKAAAALAEGGKGAGELDQLGDLMDELEMLAQEMAAAGAAQGKLQQQLAGLGQCQGGPGEFDMWQLWANKGKSSGQGQGEPEGVEEAAFNVKKEKSIGQTQRGPIIATRVVEGEQVRGEARAEFAQVVAAGERTAAEAIENNLIHREFHDAVKAYFGRLEKKVKAEELSAPGDDSDPAPAPSGG